MTHRLSLLLVLFLLACSAFRVDERLRADERLRDDGGRWTRFRGPNGTGLGDAAEVPTQWTEDDLNWKIELPGIGHSSPVVWDGRVYVTTGVRESARRSILCIDAADGRTLWRRDFASKTYRQHGANSYATATPAVDALGVVVTWTSPEEVVLLAHDHRGERLWQRNLGPFVGGRGSGASPIILGDLVVLANDQENPNLLPENIGRPEPIAPIGESFLIAVDRRTGVTRWKLDRRTGIAAYSTPCVYRHDDGTSELIFTSTAHGITAVDPATGRVQWEIGDLLPERCVASPTVAPGLVFVGYGRGIRGTSYWAVRPGLKSAGTKPTVAYEITQAVPLVPTPLVKDDRLFLWGDDGVVSCLAVEDGRVLWRDRAGGSFFGSPVCVGDRLYCVSRDGEVVVLAAADRFEVLGRVPLGEACSSTPAVADGTMYVRTVSHLLSVGG